MIKEKIKDNLNLIIGVITVLCFLIAIWQLQLALYQIEYPNLNVKHQIDEGNGVLKITIENTASRKETGTINFYRLEVSDLKPHLQLESLGPGDKRSFGALINVDEKYYNESVLKEYLTLMASERLEITTNKLYMMTEATSISYKITCDNCYRQGIVKRIPDWETIEAKLACRLGSNTTGCFLPIYSWNTFNPEGLE